MKTKITIALGFLSIFYSNAQNIIPETGSVGIGTTTPVATLNVRSSGSIAASDLSNSAILVGTTTSGLGFDRNEIHTVNNDLNIGTLTTNRHIYVKAGGNTTRMFVDGNTGNIGIGTSRPESSLHIDGDLQMDLGEGFRLHDDRSFFGQNNDGIIFEIQDTNGTLGRADGGFVYRGYTPTDNASKDLMVIKGSGNVGIGTIDPQNKLSVDGTIWSTEVIVSLTDAADWVFEKDYNLKPLEEVEAFIKKNKHLPEIPSADDFRANDLKVSEMSNKLLQKIEELTLYIIDINKRIKFVEKENTELKAQKNINTELLERLTKLEKSIIKN